MCLVVNKEKTEKFRKKHRNHKQVTVWKVVEYLQYNFKTIDRYRSAYMSKYVNKGWYKADEKIQNCELFLFENLDKIYGGVIHVFETQKRAIAEISSLTHLTYAHHIILKCSALVEDFVAAGQSNDLCFKKIWIPKTQVP